MNKDRTQFASLIGFTDLLFNLVVGITYLFILSFLLINPVGKKTTVEREGIFVVVATWNEGLDADVDLWTRAPNGETSGFLSRDQNTLSLLRDDLGNVNDYKMGLNGEQVLNPLNREEITIRTPLTGRYMVNLHLFNHREALPEGGVRVQVVVKRIKTDEILVQREVHLKNRGDEATPFIFTLDENYNVASKDFPETPIPWVLRNSIMGGNVP